LDIQALINLQNQKQNVLESTSSKTTEIITPVIVVAPSGKVPGVPPVPAVPKIPVPSISSVPSVSVPKVAVSVPKVEEKQEASHLDEVTTLGDTNPGLMAQINSGGFKLKKVTTVEKTGIEFIKKNSVTKQSGAEPKTTSSGGGAQKSGNFMDEMKKIALKKVNK